MIRYLFKFYVKKCFFVGMGMMKQFKISFICDYIVIMQLEFLKNNQISLLFLVMEKMIFYNKNSGYGCDFLKVGWCVYDLYYLQYCLLKYECGFY